MTGVPGYDVLAAGKIRRAVARRMRLAVTEMPHVTLHRQVSAAALLAARARLAAGQDQAGGARITLTVLLAGIVARSLREYPRLNGRTEQDEIRLYHRVNVGVAVALADGLVAPVIRDADRKSLPDIARELAGLTQQARDGRLAPADLADATFTVTSLGAFGVEQFTPIINPPQFGILGVGAVVPAVRLIGGRPAELPLLGLSLSFDHAALDGAQAARFLQIVAGHIEAADGDAPAG